MIGQWRPSQSSLPDLTLLQTFAELGKAAFNQPYDLNTAVSSDSQKQAQPWLKLNEEQWQNSITALEETQIFDLAVFFTLAEQQLSGWQCGAKNPAIWLFRYLRKEQKLPAKEKIHQLKKLTDNRFIPYGSVL